MRLCLSSTKPLDCPHTILYIAELNVLFVTAQILNIIMENESVKGGSNNSDKLICALSCVYFFFENMGCGLAKITSKLVSLLSPCTIFSKKKTHARGCKAIIRILEFKNQNF